MYCQVVMLLASLYLLELFTLADCTKGSLIHTCFAVQKAGFSKRKHLPAHVTFTMLEARLKALRDLQADQKLKGYGRQHSIRDMIKQMVNNFQAGMAKMKRE